MYSLHKESFVFYKESSDGGSDGADPRAEGEVSNAEEGQGQGQGPKAID